MSTPDLKKRLIDKIQKTENQAILEEVYRLLEIETEDLEIYKLNDEQKLVVQEAKEQIKNGKFLPDEEVNKNIDEWLNK